MNVGMPVRASLTVVPIKYSYAPQYRLRLTRLECYPFRMKQPNRGIFRLAAFLTTGFVLAVVAGSVWVFLAYGSQLPSPENANRQELLRWLVTRDLGEESAHTREVFARRLDSEFVGVDWGSLDSRMSDEHRRRLWANLPLLLQPWFMDKLEAYLNCSDTQRPAFVDGTIDRIIELSGMDCLRATSDGSRPPGLMPLFFERVETYKEQARPERQRQMSQFVAAMQTRWLIRALTNDLPSKAG